MSVATLPFPPQSTTRRPFRLSLVLAARAAFQLALIESDLNELLPAVMPPGFVAIFTKSDRYCIASTTRHTIPNGQYT